MGGQWSPFPISAEPCQGALSVAMPWGGAPQYPCRNSANLPRWHTSSWLHASLDSHGVIQSWQGARCWWNGLCAVAMGGYSCARRRFVWIGISVADQCRMLMVCVVWRWWRPAKTSSQAKPMQAKPSQWLSRATNRVSSAFPATEQAKQTSKPRLPLCVGGEGGHTEEGNCTAVPSVLYVK